MYGRWMETAGAGMAGEQARRERAAGVGQTLPVPLTKDTCREQVTELMAINNTSDKVSL